MKAAVMFGQGQLPEYTDFPEPISDNEDNVLVSVRAVAIKHFDKGRASGKHYSGGAATEAGRVIGGDGVCTLADGSRVYAMGATGMLAERALIERDRIVPLPDGVADVVAAALPNAVIGSAMALRFKAGIQPGDVVLINGATGFTGRVAVQLAKHYGARKVIVTGRNAQSLHDLIILGADESVTLMQTDEQFIAQVKDIHARMPIDIVVDYLWGHTAELLLASLKGTGAFTHKTRYVSVGAITGDLIQLSAANLRSVDLQLTGSGLGSWSGAQVRHLFTELLPGAFQLAAEGKLKVETVSVALKDIAGLWQLSVDGGQRLVVVV